PCCCVALLLPLWTPAEQASLVLHTATPRPPVIGADRGRFLDHLDGEIAAADLPHLARGHELVERIERLVERRGLVREMQLVEIDAVGPEPPERVVTRARDVGGARPALAFVVDRSAELGGDERSIAATGQRPAEELLAPGP